MTLNLRNLFDLIFPPSEDELIIRKCQSLNLNLGTIGSNTIFLSDYRDPATRSAIHLMKYHHHPKALKLLANLLVDYISLHAVAEQVILIPVPLSKQRHRERGYNQVEEIAKIAAHKFENIHLNTTTLTRNRHTTPQTTLPKKDRLDNVKNAFGLNSYQASKDDLGGRKVILLDDVTTTGATLEAAKTPLLSLYPTSITCLALAH